MPRCGRNWRSYLGRNPRNTLFFTLEFGWHMNIYIYIYGRCYPMMCPQHVYGYIIQYVSHIPIPCVPPVLYGNLLVTHLQVSDVEGPSKNRNQSNRCLAAGFRWISAMVSMFLLINFSNFLYILVGFSKFLDTPEASSQKRMRDQQHIDMFVLSFSISLKLVSAVAC